MEGFSVTGEVSGFESPLRDDECIVLMEKLDCKCLWEFTAA
jgi:hypothetical protein